MGKAGWVSLCDSPMILQRIPATYAQTANQDFMLSNSLAFFGGVGNAPGVGLDIDIQTGCLEDKNWRRIDPTVCGLIV